MPSDNVMQPLISAGHKPWQMQSEVQIKRRFPSPTKAQGAAANQKRKAGIL